MAGVVPVVLEGLEVEVGVLAEMVTRFYNPGADVVSVMLHLKGSK